MTLMIQKLLSSNQIILITFTRTLENTIQIKNEKILVVFDDMIADMLGNKELNPIVTE